MNRGANERIRGNLLNTSSKVINAALMRGEPNLLSNDSKAIIRQNHFVHGNVSKEM
jgi:hypothetical protein